MPPCRRCGTDVSRRDARCAECGYAPASLVRRIAIGVVFFGGAAGLLVPPVLVLSVFLGLTLLAGSFLLTPAG